MGVGLEEAGKERVGDGIPKGMGVGRNKFCNIVQFFANSKKHAEARTTKDGGTRKGEIQVPPSPPPPPP